MRRRAPPRAPPGGRSASRLAALLCRALRGRHDTLVEELLREGADPNLVLPEEGVAPVHLAAGMEQPSGLALLLLLPLPGRGGGGGGGGRGDPNARSVEGLTPLHVAASWGRASCLTLLLEAGGDPRLQDQEGNTALDLALEQGHATCARILEEEEGGGAAAEQSGWRAFRRAESFLSTVTDDTMEAAGTPRSVGRGLLPPPVDPDGHLGLDDWASFLTECSWDEGGGTHARPEAEASEGQFRCANGTLDGSVIIGPKGPKSGAYVPPRFLRTELGESRRSAQGSFLPEASGSQETLKCDADATLDLTLYGSFLDPERAARPLETTLVSLSDGSCSQYFSCSSEASAAEEPPGGTGEPEAILGCAFRSDCGRDSEARGDGDPEAILDSPDQWRTLGLCCAGKNGSPANASQTRQDLGKHPWHRAGDRKALSQVLPECSFIAASEEECLGALGVTAAAPGREVKEKGERLRTQGFQGTVLTQRASEDTEAPGESAGAGAAETVPVSGLPPVEEELSGLEAQLRAVMLATKASRSPLLRPFDVAERHLTARDASSSSFLFEEDLEKPRRPRRVRSPEGRPPVSRRGCASTTEPRNESPSHAAGGEAGSLADTQLMPIADPVAAAEPVNDYNPQSRFHLEAKPGCCSLSPTNDQEDRGNCSDETGAGPPPVGAKEAKAARVSFSRMPVRGPPLAAAPSESLSPGGRPISTSAAAASAPVEFLYWDEDERHSLVERRVPFADESLPPSEDSAESDWRSLAERAVEADAALMRELRAFGVNPGPVTGLTRKVYLRLLEKLRSDPRTKPRKDAAGYSPELTFALETFQIPEATEDEMALIAQFDRPDQSQKWREGLLKSSFNYLLLDPRVTQNLPFRCRFVSQAECFRTFVSAVFYVGKGTRSRPYSHLYEALTHYSRGGRGSPRGEASSKVRRVLEIWESGQGVVSMHCFQNVVPVEAYTREACIVDAIGLKMLTNLRKGGYYGLVAGWPLKRRRRLGVHLLHRAMRIFLAEGERQLRPADIRPP